MNNEDTDIPVSLVRPEVSKIHGREITNNEVELYRILTANIEKARNELQEFMELMKYKALKDKYEPEVK